MFKTRIRRNVKLAESPSHGKTIFEYEPNCHGSQDYMDLAQEVLAMENSGAAEEKESQSYASPPVAGDVVEVESRQVAALTESQVESPCPSQPVADVIE